MENLFTELTMALTGGFIIAVLASFGWGILSVLLSPCHLTSIPLIIGYISQKKIQKTRSAFYSSFYFSMGILISITVIGAITSGLGRMMGDIGVISSWLVFLLLVFIGFSLLDIISLPAFQINLIKSPPGQSFNALILGILFGFSVGPCTFAFLAPVLGIVLKISSTHVVKSILLIISFAVGHCLIIILAGTSFSLVQGLVAQSGNSRFLVYTKRSAGLLILLGSIYFLLTYIL